MQLLECDVLRKRGGYLEMRDVNMVWTNIPLLNTSNAYPHAARPWYMWGFPSAGCNP